MKDERWKTIKVMIIILVMIWLAASIGAWFIDLTDSSAGSGNVAVVDVVGPITVSGAGIYGQGDGTSSEDFTLLIDEIKQNPLIEAVIIRINSPGGSPVASDEIGLAIKRLELPTVAIIKEVGVSGAYWVASATDHIIANRMSITGSIGVIGSYLEFAGLLDRYNITYQRLTSGVYKDIGSPFRNITDDERSILQNQLDRIHDYFILEVAENRNLSEDEVRAVADGLFFTGGEAFEMGLVDQLGGKEEAIVYLEQELNTTVSLVYYQHEQSLYDLLTQIATRSRGFDIMQDVPSVRT